MGTDDGEINQRPQRSSGKKVISFFFLVSSDKKIISNYHVHVHRDLESSSVGAWIIMRRGFNDYGNDCSNYSEHRICSSRGKIRDQRIMLSEQRNRKAQITAAALDGIQQFLFGGCEERSLIVIWVA